MKTSCINHPSNERLIIIRQWQYDFCEKKEVAAALLSFFEYWHNIKISMLEEKTREGAAKKQPYIPSLKDYLQFHTQKDLQAGLLGIGGKDSIIAAKKQLIEKNIITEHRNQNDKYSFDNTIYYQFHPNVLNVWLSENRQCNLVDKQTVHRLKTDNDRRETDNPPSENRQTITETTSNISFLEEGEGLAPALTPAAEVLPQISIPLNAFSVPEEKEKNSAKKEKEAGEELEFTPAAENIKRLQAAEKETALPTYGLDFNKIAWGDLSKPLISVLSDYYTQKQGSGSKLSNVAVQRSVATIERVLTTITQHQRIKTAAKAQEVLCSVLDTIVLNAYSFNEKMLVEMACKLVDKNKTGAVTDIKTAHSDKTNMAEAYFNLSQQKSK